MQEIIQSLFFSAAVGFAVENPNPLSVGCAVLVFCMFVIAVTDKMVRER